MILGAFGQGSQEGRQDRDGQSGARLLASLPASAYLLQLPRTTPLPFGRRQLHDQRRRRRHHHANGRKMEEHGASQTRGQYLPLPNSN